MTKRRKKYSHNNRYAKGRRQSEGANDAAVTSSSSSSSSHVHMNDDLNKAIEEQLRIQRQKDQMTSNNVHSSTCTRLEKNNSNDNRNSNNNDDSQMESEVLVENSRRQSLRKNKSTNNSNDETKNPQSMTADNAKKPVLGNYTFDPSRGAYFPTNDVISEKKTNKHTTTNTDTLAKDKNYSVNGHTNNVSLFDLHLRQCGGRQNDMYWKRLRSPILSYRVQAVHDAPIERRNLLGNWASRILYDSISIVPAFYQYINIGGSTVDPQTHQLISTSEEDLPHFRCSIEYDQYIMNREKSFAMGKGGSSLWSRTFDIFPPTFQTSRNPLCTPSKKIARIVRCDQSVMYDHCKRLSFPINDPYLDMSINESVICSFDRCLNSRQSTVGESFSVFHLRQWPDNESQNMSRQQHFKYPNNLEFNDVASLPFHPNRIFIGGTGNIVLDVEGDSGTMTNTSKVGKADILCVETDPHGVHPNLVLFGRRDGQILVKDCRSDDETVSSAGTLTSNRKHHRQSVYRMETLFHNRPDQLLARCSNSWCMFDLRKMTGTDNKMTTSYDMDAAVVHNIPLMDEMTQVCKGMATDPLSSTILVPVQMGDDGSPAIKLWSLETGDYLGCKPALQKSDPHYNESFHIPVTEIELCSTVTKAWSFPTNQEATTTTNVAEGSGSISTFPTPRSDEDEDEEDEGDYVSGKFGLWLKVGHLGIYHITGTGRSYEKEG